jgi:hypothetical protein
LVARPPNEKIHFFTLFIRDLCQVEIFVKPKMNSPQLDEAFEGKKSVELCGVFLYSIETDSYREINEFIKISPPASLRITKLNWWGKEVCP